MPQHNAVRRSWLIVPGSDPAKISAAPSSGADVVVLDLADFVADHDKPIARDGIQPAFATVKAGGAEVFVQIDPALLLADLRAAIWPGVAGVIVGQLQSDSQIHEADELISQLESQRGLLPGSVEIVASLETAQGNHNGFEIATASRRISALTLGRADLIMDLRPEPSGEIHLMQYLMQRLITLASATGKTPLGAWWRAPDRGLLATPENTLAAAQRGRAIGFQGSLCVLDNQVGPLNAGFTPSAAELAEADPRLRSVEGNPLARNVARQHSRLAALAAACEVREQFKAAAVEGRPIPLP
jgi:citrate lyase subunit beta/citryl-CoA lyase